MSTGRGQKTEDRGQRLPRGFSAPAQQPAQSADKNLSSVFSLLSSDRGFSLFELVVVISIIAVLASVFLSKVLYYQEQAERTAMVEVVGVIQNALILQYGDVLTRGRASDIPFIKNDNPMNWLQQKPHNYAGEFEDPTPSSVEPGNWVFDLKSRELIYVLNIANNFKPGKDNKNWIRYHVTIKYEPSRLPSLQDAPPELTSMQFEPVEPYSWFSEGNN